jgi:NAD-dependent dihydropyrimidine dehydrogenase PreA subunit
MGHMAGKELYRQLGRKIDSLTFRAPWNESLHAILKELYSEEEADLVVRMPWGMSTLDRLEQCTGHGRAALERLLEQLCVKGLVMDIEVAGKCRYMPSPLVIGIFEFTMMRTGEGLKSKEWARLFRDYFDSGVVWEANAGGGRQLQVMRTVPHEGTLRSDEQVEVLDYERATAIVESQQRFAVGICSCRHEKRHAGENGCTIPLESCTSMGTAADFMIRRKLGVEVSRSQMLEQLARSREAGLVLNADNVQRRVSFICNCCSCCCNVLLGVRKFGYPHAVLTSSYIAAVDHASCEGCGDCGKACPVDAISFEKLPQSQGKKRARPVISEEFCLGCGVCALRCRTGALVLRKRKARVIHPESTLERVIVQCLEIGTLQNQLFDDPNRITHRFMRAFVGGVLRLPPVKKALLGETLRSRFISALKSGAAKGRDAAAAGL